MIFGYIYIRTNEFWDIYEVYKLGKTDNIPNRETTYLTSEIKKGYYIMVIEIELSSLNNIEKELHKYFTKLNLNLYFNAGTEFYKKDIINYIIPYFNQSNIPYRVLSEDEINNLIRKIKQSNTIKDNYTNFENKIEKIENIKEIYSSKEDDQIIISKSFESLNLEDNNENRITNKYNEREYQTQIIDIIFEYFQNNNKGILILPCGAGKTYIALSSLIKLEINRILIGVPNILLLKQWENIISNLFQNVPYLIISSILNKIDIFNITRFLQNNLQRCIVITTYSSAHKIYTATNNINFVFDIKVNDEVHHLTSNNIDEEDKKTYIKMLKIKSIKELSLTATLKLLENITNDKNVISNDNIEHFGEIIDKKSLLWAINNNIVCDYLIQTIISEKNELEDQLIKFNILEDNDKRLFLSAYASLKSISDGNSHHILIYSNNKNNSLKIIEFVKLLLNNNYFNIPDLYYSNYHSEMRSTDQKNIINNFERTKFGIITCVYCLSEGWDFPTLDAVVFAENMSSNIRIVQSALRASRKNKNEPDKITKIILPILNQDNWLDNNENSDLKKVKEIIYQIGLEDESIVQKIKVLKMTIEKKVEKDKDDNQEYNRDLSNFGEYDEELTKKIKLKTIKRTIFGTSYEKARKIIFAKNIKNKEDYFNLCEKDIRLSDEPEITYKAEFKNWIEYLSIGRIYYDYEECKKKVNEYLSLYPHIKNNFLDIYSICKELCKLDSKFPPNGLWIEYYDITDLKDIFKITNIKKKINLNI